MCNDKIEYFLTGEYTIGKSELVDDKELEKIEMTDLQKTRILEIHNYVKRQNNLRTQRIDF